MIPEFVTTQSLSLHRAGGPTEMGMTERPSSLIRRRRPFFVSVRWTERGSDGGLREGTEKSLSLNEFEFGGLETLLSHHLLPINVAVDRVQYRPIYIWPKMQN